MTRRLLNEKGVSLVELLIALAILGIVLDLGMVFFNHTQNSYDRNETKYIAQSNVRLASDFINHELSYATEVSVINAGDVPNTASGDDNYIYVGNNGSITHLDSATGVRTVNPLTSKGRSYDLSFDRTGTGKGTNKILEYSVTDSGDGYNVESKINPANLESNDVITTSLTGAGTAIKYRKPSTALSPGYTTTVYPGEQLTPTCCGC